MNKDKRINIKRQRNHKYMTKEEFCKQCPEKSPTHCKDCPLNYKTDEMDFRSTST